MEIESERAKQSQSQLEKTQMARERAHKQRVKGLEEQVSCLSQHLSVWPCFQLVLFGKENARKGMVLLFLDLSVCLNIMSYKRGMRASLRFSQVT